MYILSSRHRFRFVSVATIAINIMILLLLMGIGYTILYRYMFQMVNTCNSYIATCIIAMCVPSHNICGCCFEAVRPLTSSAKPSRVMTIHRPKSPFRTNDISKLFGLCPLTTLHGPLSVHPTLLCANTVCILPLA